MDSDNIISGIHNWCDRWCEKCAFIKKCSVGILESEIVSKDEEEMEKILWEKLELEKINPEFLEALAEAEEEMNDPEWIEKYSAEENLRKIIVDTHPIPTIAHEYAENCREWLKNDKVKKTAKELSAEDFEISVNECLEIVNWYQYFIPSKCVRMISEKEDDIWDEFTSSERSYNGTAKITLIAIERSISAFILLLNYLKSETSEIKRRLFELQKLKKTIEAHFPDANKFIRPGFDE